MTSVRAVIYVVSEPAVQEWVLRCIAHVQRRGYELVAVVIDDHNGGGWASVERLRDDRQAEVVVTPRVDDPPADRVPRTEYLQHVEKGPALTPRQRRPRLIPRDEAG